MPEADLSCCKAVGRPPAFVPEQECLPALGGPKRLDRFHNKIEKTKPPIRSTNCIKVWQERVSGPR